MTPVSRSDPPPTSSRHRASWPLVALIALVAAGAGTAAGRGFHAAPAQTPPMADMPGMESGGPSPKAVYISPARQQLVGVRTGTVARQSVEGTVRTVGMVTYDETRVAEIHTRVSGWVEQLYVNYVGKPVRQGQPLFALYSPDLVTAEGEYLIAAHARDQAGLLPPEEKTAANAFLTASHQRLKRLEMTDAQIDALEKAGTVSRTVTLSSPFDGVVLEKSAVAGQYVTPEMMTFKLADLSSVWVVGQAFEYEAVRFQVGNVIDVEFPYGQADKLEATIDFIYPGVDPQTRRVRFRATLKNPDRKLKPDTYVTLTWHGSASDRLVVPKEAVIDTGDRKYVLLALDQGYFEPRDVQLGLPAGEFYSVVSGVAEGDRVVTSAQFLIDSETNLMAAMQNMSMSMPGMDMGTKPVSPAMSAMPTISSMPMPPSSKPAPKPTTTTVPPSATVAPSSAPSSMPPMPDMNMPMDMPMNMPMPSGHH